MEFITQQQTRENIGEKFDLTLLEKLIVGLFG